MVGINLQQVENACQVLKKLLDGMLCDIYYTCI